MILLAVAALLVAVVSIAAAAAAVQLARGMVREHARERQLLINQILHATGQTWQPPPAEPVAADPVDDDPVEERYVAFPAAEFD